MTLVAIQSATKRKKPRSLTVEEFRAFLEQLEEPIRTVALVCVSFGLRISEALALKWSDVDWLNGRLQVARGIVRQRVGEVKTEGSEQLMSVDADFLTVFKAWKQTTQFSSEDDWMFASPVQLGRLPISYPWVWKSFQQAAVRAGIPKFGTHSLRHSYRSWLDAVGTPIAVQQKLMRHADIRTTMNVYGNIVTDEMEQAQSKIVRLALNGLQTDCKPS
jgi:integrase